MEVTSQRERTQPKTSYDQQKEWLNYKVGLYPMDSMEKLRI